MTTINPLTVPHQLAARFAELPARVHALLDSLDTLLLTEGLIDA